MLPDVLIEAGPDSNRASSGRPEPEERPLANVGKTLLTLARVGESRGRPASFDVVGDRTDVAVVRWLTTTRASGRATVIDDDLHAPRASRCQHRHAAGVRLGVAPPGQGPLRVRLVGSSARTSRRQGHRRRDGHTDGGAAGVDVGGVPGDPAGRCRRSTGAATAVGSTTARRRRRTSRGRRRSPPCSPSATGSTRGAAALAREQRVRPGLLLRRLLDGFRRWLEARYGDLDGLNEAWGTTVWGNTLRDWSEIELPSALNSMGRHAGRCRELRSEPEHRPRPRPVLLAQSCCDCFLNEQRGAARSHSRRPDHDQLPRPDPSRRLARMGTAHRSRLVGLLPADRQPLVARLVRPRPGTWCRARATSSCRWRPSPGPGQLARPHVRSSARAGAARGAAGGRPRVPVALLYFQVRQARAGGRAQPLGARSRDTAASTPVPAPS